MLDFSPFLPPLLLLIFLPLLLSVFILKLSSQKPENPSKLPKPYPIIGHLVPLYRHTNDRFEWITTLLSASRSSTFILHRLFGRQVILTADPTVVKHILKTRFAIYEKGAYQRQILKDLFGHGMFVSDGEDWRFQRQIASHEFDTKSLRKFIETVVDTELSDRLIPVLLNAATNNVVLDLQDVLERFAFDNICRISFGYDPEYLSPSLPHAKFALAFEEAIACTARRYKAVFPILWKIQKVLNIGSERKLRQAVVEIRGFANSLVKRKKQQMMMISKDSNEEGTSETEADDLLSRMLQSGHSDENFITDNVIGLILAGRDTTSSALTWFFWLLHKNQRVEDEILMEIKNKDIEHSSVLTEVKELSYLHAAISESMRLYPPVPLDMKETAANDVLPDGTHVKKGTRVVYHTYAMGRSEKLWGPSWSEFRPERWLEKKGEGWRYVGRDPYSYPVFQAGPRVCLGKEMAYQQMKRVMAGVLRRFRVVPTGDGFEPVYVPNLTSKMQGGFPVRVEERN